MKKCLFFFLFSIITINLSATHIMGGEITWTCITDQSSPDYGKYIFTLKVYRDCTGTALTIGTFPLEVWGHPTVSSIALTHIATNDISPQGVGANCLECNPLSPALPQLGAVEEWVFISSPIALPGIPPIGGWHFTWDSCCRNGAITNLVLSSITSPSEGFTLRAAMFPYTDNSGNLVPADPCHDNSPIFKEDAKTILCTGYPFSYSNLGFDVELDSISYSWDEPLDDFFGTFNPPVTPAPIPWLAPYSTTSPLPGGITLDPITGQISYNSNTSGNFVSVIRADAFRCGQKIASIYREIQVVLMACGNLTPGNPNSPPTMISPFTDPITGLPSNDIIVMAGRPLSFRICAEDIDTNASGILQNLILEIQGGQLDPLLSISDSASFSVDTVAPGYICGEFFWNPNCFHMQDLGCGVGGNGLYTFNIKAYDDFCPANGIVIATITINVVPPVPDLRCLAVDVSGGVDVSLTYPLGVSDTNIKYDLYFSKQIGGPYSLVDSIKFPDTTLYHAGSNANNSKSYYYLVGTGTCGTNISSVGDSLLYSDTLSTILMNASSINLGNTADLDWNPIHNPLLSSSALDYDLHYINANNNDVIIQVFPDTFSQMDGDRCNYYPQFYVEILDESGCISRSSIGTTHLLDTITPTTPNIESVSVNNLGQSEISWENSADADYYIVYIQDNNGAWITLDSVSSVPNTYIYQNSQASSVIENFSVRAADSCGNSRVKSLMHNSMLLKYSSNACDYSILLDWNEYINWVGGTNHYKALITETDSNNAITITEVRVEGGTDLMIENINNMSSYTIVVEAYNSDSSFVAVSNQININIALANKPLFNYIEYATVNHNDGSVDISCIVDLVAVIDRYDVYRSLSFTDDNFSKIGEVNFSNLSPIHYNDIGVSTDNYSYQYKIYPVDTCGVSLSVPVVNLPGYLNVMSFAQTILLEVEVNIDSLPEQYTNTLVFNNYDKWLGEVSHYNLYRSYSGEDFNFLKTLYPDNPLVYVDLDPDNPLIYVDVVTDFYEGDGKFCYYIEAVEGKNIPYQSVLEVSKSNIVCVSQVPVIFIPSVFTPNGDGHNEIFIPNTYFVSTNGYTFSIYNREGEVIFETNNPKKGWDGSFLGSQVQNGKYVYHLKFLNSHGELTEKTGIITLVR